MKNGEYTYCVYFKFFKSNILTYLSKGTLSEDFKEFEVWWINFLSSFCEFLNVNLWFHKIIVVLKQIFYHLFLCIKHYLPNMNIGYAQYTKKTNLYNYKLATTLE